MLCTANAGLAWSESGLRRCVPKASATQPDFSYDQMKALVYVDGPHHRNVATKTVDDVKRSTLRDAGYKVVIFTDDSTSWPTVFGEFPFVFGKGNA